MLLFLVTFRTPSCLEKGPHMPGTWKICAQFDYGIRHSEERSFYRSGDMKVTHFVGCVNGKKFRRKFHCLIATTTSFAVFAWKINFRMNDAHVSSKCIGSAEGLFFSTQCASNLLLADVVNSIFVTSKIIRA